MNKILLVQHASQATFCKIICATVATALQCPGALLVLQITLVIPVISMVISNSSIPLCVSVRICISSISQISHVFYAKIFYLHVRLVKSQAPQHLLSLNKFPVSSVNKVSSNKTTNAQNAIKNFWVAQCVKNKQIVK